MEEKESKSLGYTLGRLYALLEFLHDSCKNRYGRMISFNFTIVYPYCMAQQLIDAKFCFSEMPEYEIFLAEIVLNLPGDDLPKHLSTEEQGAFIKGYFTDKNKYKTLRIQIGNNIARLRREKKLTQRELAEKADISNSNIANIELGKYSCGVDILQRIAGALECSPKDLMPE